MKHLCPHHCMWVGVGEGCYLIWFPFSVEASSKSFSCFILASGLSGGLKGVQGRAVVFVLAVRAAGVVVGPDLSLPCATSFLPGVPCPRNEDKVHPPLSASPT